MYNQETDRRALLALFNATAGAGWRNNKGWVENSDDIQTWFGVSVNDSGRVNAVLLPRNDLNGARNMWFKSFVLVFSSENNASSHQEMRAPKHARLVSLSLPQDYIITTQVGNFVCPRYRNKRFHRGLRMTGTNCCY